MDEVFPKKVILWWMDAEVLVLIYDLKAVCVGNPGDYHEWENYL